MQPTHWQIAYSRQLQASCGQFEGERISARNDFPGSAVDAKLLVALPRIMWVSGELMKGKQLLG
jgi:hypothetical protein